MTDRAKWSAWKSVSSLARDDAERRYCDLLTSHAPQWREWSGLPSIPLDSGVSVGSVPFNGSSLNEVAKAKVDGPAENAAPLDGVADQVSSSQAPKTPTSASLREKSSHIASTPNIKSNLSKSTVVAPAEDLPATRVIGSNHAVEIRQVLVW